MIYTHNDLNPFLGYEDDDLMIGKNGECTIGFEMILPPVFTLPEDIYDNLIERFSQGIKILPNYCRIHRQDFITKNTIKLQHRGKNNFFNEEYARTFSSMPMMMQESYIYFTLIPKILHHASVAGNNAIKTKGFPKVNRDEIRDFKEGVEQFIALLSSVVNQNEDGQPPYISFKKLKPEQYLKSISARENDGVLAKTLFLQDPIYADITYNKRSSELRVGEKLVDIFSLSCLENAPQQINSSLTYDLYNLPTGWAAYLAPVVRFPHIVNTYIIKGDPEEEKKSLEQKKKFLQAFAYAAHSNERGVRDIEDFLAYAEEQKSSIIDVHVNIILWDTDERALAIKRQSISTICSKLGCENLKAETYNKLNLFIASLPGAAINIYSEYRFKTLDMVGAMLCNYAGLQKSDNTPNGLRVVDRISKSTINIDIDEPYTKHNFNKNMFVLGGSGSGKSFSMNYYLNSELETNTDVVIVDIGRSYEGLCDIHGGKWFEFTEETPLSFNPFILSKEDWNTNDQLLSDEKSQALCGIIKVLWKGPDGIFDQTENTILKDLLTGYYRDNRIQERKFNTFYEFAQQFDFPANVDFNKEKFFYNLKTYYKDGNYPMLLNAALNTSLVDEKLIIFELDNIKNNKLLLSVTTTIIMDIFVTKMRFREERKKIIMFEEAWMALDNEDMSSYIQWLAKTARKFNAKLVVVTQELDDIVKSKIGPALISNCSEKFLLDQSNFKTNFDVVQKILGLSDFQKNQVLSINKGKEPGDKSKDFFIGFQYGKSYVVQLSVSRAEALLYSSSQEDKAGIRLVAKNKNLSYTEAIEYIITHLIQDIDTLSKKTNCNFYEAIQKLLENHL